MTATLLVSSGTKKPHVGNTQHGHVPTEGANIGRGGPRKAEARRPPTAFTTTNQQTPMQVRAVLTARFSHRRLMRLLAREHHRSSVYATSRHHQQSVHVDNSCARLQDVVSCGPCLRCCCCCRDRPAAAPDAVLDAAPCVRQAAARSAAVGR